jgi:K+-sensing histidine kinase KdpD
MNEPKKLPTEFAPAERATNETLRQQFAQIHNLPLVREFLDAIPNMSIVLNQERQIIYANKAFLNFLGEFDFADILGKRQGEVLKCQRQLSPIGLRTGEALDCVHSHESEGGCGTTLFCRTCGAVRSILESQEKNELSIEECRMIRNEDNEERALDLRIWSKPIMIDGKTFTIFSVVDISDEKRRRVLERIFFHDILNTSGGVQGLANILADADLKDDELNEISKIMYEATHDLVDEIHTQRTLSQAESGELQLGPTELNTKDLIEATCKQIANHEVALTKHITTPDTPEIIFQSDYNLVRRVLLNLVKNALEASEKGGTVTLNCRAEGSTLQFTVHNTTVMPLDVQLQIFNRSFSTKGANRGIGTYSIKLLTERYLKGKVSFLSSEETGTIFKVSLPLQIS